MAVVSMKQLLEAGVHFGHQTRRWNPKMAEYIFTERNGIYIIDLQKSVKKLEEAYNFVRELSAEGKSVLFVVVADVVISWVTGAVVSSTQLSVITSEKSLMLPTASEAARLSSKASTSGARVVVGTTRAAAARDTAIA
jgi:hypothetical protein